MTSVQRLENVGPALSFDLDEAGFRNPERLSHGHALEVD
jgi:hypothetical protein